LVIEASQEYLRVFAAIYEIFEVVLFGPEEAGAKNNA
jgi:hypothetical protein